MNTNQVQPKLQFRNRNPVSFVQCQKGSISKKKVEVGINVLRFFGLRPDSGLCKIIKIDTPPGIGFDPKNPNLRLIKSRSTLLLRLLRLFRVPI